MGGNGSIIEQKIIDQQYQGDIAAYKRDMADKASRVYRWQDIEAHAKVLPEYEEEALRQIKFHLGYLPSRQVTLPHEPFIRHALYRYDFVHNDFDKLCAECRCHIINIK